MEEIFTFYGMQQIFKQYAGIGLYTSLQPYSTLNRDFKRDLVALYSDCLRHPYLPTYQAILPLTIDVCIFHYFPIKKKYFHAIPEDSVSETTATQSMTFFNHDGLHLFWTMPHITFLEYMRP